tara:strand:+ start:3387 stop:4022 length:636 start_codon:yes stop_codon:yes gene_type:complete
MPKNIFFYTLLLLLLIGSSLFISSYFLSNNLEILEGKENTNTIFQAKGINLNLNFKNSNLSLKVSSEMINSKKNEKNLYVFEPSIQIKGDDTNLKINSKRAVILYDRNLIKLIEGIEIDGRLSRQNVKAKTKKLTVDLEEKSFFSEEIEMNLDARTFIFSKIVFFEELVEITGSPIKIIDKNLFESETDKVLIQKDGSILFPKEVKALISR